MIRDDHKRITGWQICIRVFYTPLTQKNHQIFLTPPLMTVTWTRSLMLITKVTKPKQKMTRDLKQLVNMRILVLTREKPAFGNWSLSIQSYIIIWMRSLIHPNLSWVFFVMIIGGIIFYWLWFKNAQMIRIHWWHLINNLKAT